MAAISNDWLQPLQKEFKKPYYRKLYDTVKREYSTYQVFPPADDIFNAFHLTPLSEVKVVILGQDPYHNVNQAHGLCFSVQPTVEIPPSLENIYKELHDDLGCKIPNNGYLVKWAKQGVLLLNTVLTVRAHQANSHQNIGWEQFRTRSLRSWISRIGPWSFCSGASRPSGKRHAAQPEPPDSGSAPSQSAVRLPGIFSGAGISARPISFWRSTV